MRFTMISSAARRGIAAPSSSTIRSRSVTHAERTMQLLSLGLLFGATAAGLAAEATPREFFEMRVRPVLARSCLTCHAATHMGGLDMTSRDGLLKGGNSGPAVVPGEPEQS